MFLWKSCPHPAFPASYHGLTCKSFLLRLELYDAGFWGDPARISFDKAIKEAWLDFKRWKKLNQISYSQPSFRAHRVSWRLTCQINFKASSFLLACPKKPIWFESKSGHDQVTNKDNEALWALKAFNGRVVCAWLATCAVELSRSKPLDEEAAVLAACMPSP